MRLLLGGLENGVASEFQQEVHLEDGDVTGAREGAQVPFDRFQYCDELHVQFIGDPHPC